jgi:L-amino acid N-acyltransferase
MIAMAFLSTSSDKPDAGVRIRLAGPADNEAIRAIYNHVVVSTTLVFDIVARSAAEQGRWLEEHSGPHPALVAVDDDGVVVGFGSLSPYRPRPAYATTVEDSVYVDAAHQGRGVGRRILSGLVETAAAHGFHAIIGRIVGHNEASIALHRSCGFFLVGVEKEVGRKFNTWLDVVEMQCLL